MVMPTVDNIVLDVLALFYLPYRESGHPRFSRAPFAIRDNVSLLISTVARHVPKPHDHFCPFTTLAPSVTQDQNFRGIIIVDNLVLDARVPSVMLHRLPWTPLSRVQTVSFDHAYRDMCSVATLVLAD